MSRNLESSAPRNMESGVQRLVEGVVVGNHFDETGRSLSVVATLVATTAIHYDETGRSLPVVATPSATTQADFKNTLLGVSINSLITGVDNKGGSGHYADIGLLIGIGCSVTTATYRADYNDTARLFPIVSTVTGTASKRFDATGCSIAIAATMTITTRRKLQQSVSVPIVATLTHTDNKWTTTVLNHAAALYLGSATVSRVYSGAVRVWP